jgi:hypothetical protein
MATRMQQRRGTAEQWTLVNPTLAEGEIGFETDTNQFKIGNGVNAWGSLPYFETLDDIQTYVNNAVAGVIDAAPGTLDTLNELAAAINDDDDFFNSITTAYQAYADQAEVDAKAYADTQDAALSATITAAYEAYVDGQTADSATVTYVDDGDAVTLTAANTYTDARESAITTAYQSYADTAETDAKAYTDTEIANLVDSSPATLDTLNELAAALGDDANFATTVTNSIATKAPLDSPSFTGTVDFSNSTVQGLEIPQPIHPFVMLGA